MAAPRHRRFEHAHPIARGPHGVPRSPRRVGQAGATVAVIGFAVVAAMLVFRPFDAGSPAAAGMPMESGRSAAGPATSPAAVVSSQGPHGDTVPQQTQSAPSTQPNVSSARPASGPTTAGGLTGYRWPLENARITNGFGPGRPGSFVVDGETFHDGIDIASFCGAPIVAAHDGVVLAASRHHEAFLGWLGDLGPFRARVDAEQAWNGQAITAVTDDGNGYRSIYAHLARTAIEVGAEVKAGETIGYEGASGYATGCHLHFALFSPAGTLTLALDPKVAAKSKLPAFEIMRIDPLLVLPPPEVASITWGWGARDGP